MIADSKSDVARAEHRPMSHADYHAEREHDSSSSLRLFEESPARYYHTRITGRIQPKPETDAMRLGTATHVAILEPERIHELVEVIPPEVLSSDGAKRGKKWEAWRDEHQGLVHVSQAEFDALKWQVENAWTNSAVRAVLERVTVREHSIFWTTKDGYRLKCRMDAAQELDGQIIDLKRTARTERDFWRAVKDFAYHRQAALYCAGFKALYGVRARFHFLIVQSEPPYECCIRTLPLDALKLGHAENKETLKQLYECRRGARRWVTDGYEQIRELDLPPFFYPED